MYPFILTIFLFFYFFYIGYIFLKICNIRLDNFLVVMLSPAVGLSLVILICFWLSRVGFSVEKFGLVFFIVSIILMLTAIYYRKIEIFFYRDINVNLLFLLLMFSMLFVSRPMFKYGFDWLSISNSDMGEYVLLADGLFKRSYFEIPNISSIISNTDYSCTSWFSFVILPSRPGGPIILALIKSCTGLSFHNIFMPLMVFLNSVILFSSGSLIYYMTRKATDSYILISILAIMSNNLLGVISQLLAQVCGIGLLIASILFIDLLFISIMKESKKRHIGLLLINATILASLLISYSEIFPFIIFYLLIYLFCRMIETEKNYAFSSKLVILYISIFFLLIFIFLQSYIYNSIINIIVNFLIGTTSVEDLQRVILFPYYLLPIGFTYFWGLLTFVDTYPIEPILSIEIILGMFLYSYCIIIAITQIKKINFFAIMSFLMLMIGVFLFIKQSDFGLFKIAMFIQPFIIGLLVSSKKNKFNYILLILLFILNVNSSNKLVNISYGDLEHSKGKLVLIPYASSKKINVEFQNILSLYPSNSFFYLDTFNTSVKKFQYAYLYEKPNLFFCDRTSLPRLDKWIIPSISTIRNDENKRKIQNVLNVLKNKIEERYEHVEYNTTVDNTIYNKFWYDKRYICNEINNIYIFSSPILSIFNRTKYKNDIDHFFISKNEIDCSNEIIFIESEKGRYSGVKNSDTVAFTSLEPDWLYENCTMSGVGRYLLLQIVNYKDNSRMLIDITSTLKSDGENIIPPIKLLSDEIYYYDSIGRGSARLFSPIFKPKKINDRYYIEIDMGVDPTSFPSERKGLMKMFGTDIPIDYRKLVCFARNISIISDDEYNNLKLPNGIENFRNELKNENLEYSGCYEDGWISEDSYFVLEKSDIKSKLIIKGTIPYINDKNIENVIIVSIGENTIIRKEIGVGDFIINEEIEQIGKIKVNIHNTKYQSLPGNDMRKVSAKLFYIGFK